MKIVEWVLAVILGLILFAAGASRIANSDIRADLSDQLNVPSWFLILVSLLEIALGIYLIWPRFRILGGIGATIVMIGAAIFNVFGDTVDDVNPRTAIPLNLVLAVVGLIVAWLAAGRPNSIGTLIETARRQAMGQVAAVAETAADIVD